jgi:hypothetical protein
MPPKNAEGFFWRLALVIEIFRLLDLNSMHPKSADSFFRQTLAKKKSDCQPQKYAPQNAESFFSAQRSSKIIFRLLDLSCMHPKNAESFLFNKEMYVI